MDSGYAVFAAQTLSREELLLFLSTRIPVFSRTNERRWTSWSWWWSWSSIESPKVGNGQAHKKRRGRKRRLCSIRKQVEGRSKDGVPGTWFSRRRGGGGGRCLERLDQSVGRRQMDCRNAKGKSLWTEVGCSWKRPWTKAASAGKHFAEHEWCKANFAKTTRGAHEKRLGRINATVPRWSC